MNRILKGLQLLFLVWLVQGCDVSDDGPSYHYVTLQITDVEVPESFQLHESYEIGVTLLRPNSCTSFEGFDVISESTTTRRVVAIGAEFAGTCNELAEVVQTSFRFICLYDSPYLFRFYAGPDSNGDPQYIEVVVPVE